MFPVTKKLITIALATPLLIVGAAGAASASSTITWSTGGKCLTYATAPLTGDLAYTDHLVLDPCGAGYGLVDSFIDVQVVSGVWLEHPSKDVSYCLTGYKHRVFFEKCQPNNNWERWEEISSGGNWYLWNVAEGEYLNAPDSIGRAYTSSFPQAWH